MSDIIEAERVRFQVYNKDPEFFWDHKYGRLFHLNMKNDPDGSFDSSEYVNKIVKLLNDLDIKGEI